MPVAFLLINTEIDAMEKVLKSLKRVESVKEAYSVYGVYDVIVKVKVDTLEKLKEVVTWKIRKISGVRNTLTMTVVG